MATKSNPPPIRVLIADDFPVVREGLAAMINRQQDIRVVVAVSNGQEAVEQFLRHRPDIALLDIRMPRMDGIAAMQAILAECPEARIILLSAVECDEHIYRGLKAGAKSYVLKHEPLEELLRTIRYTHAGGTYILPAVAAKLTNRLTRPELSNRETEVLRLMSLGKSNKEIGSALHICEGTVKVHVSSLLRKLNATGRSEAINLAITHGLVMLN